MIPLGVICISLLSGNKLCLFNFFVLQLIETASACSPFFHFVCYFSLALYPNHHHHDGIYQLLLGIKMVPMEYGLYLRKSSVIQIVEFNGNVSRD